MGLFYRQLRLSAILEGGGLKVGRYEHRFEWMYPKILFPNKLQRIYFRFTASCQVGCCCQRHSSRQ